MIGAPEFDKEVYVLTNDSLNDSWRFYEQHKAKYTRQGWVLLDSEINSFEVIAWRIG